MSKYKEINSIDLRLYPIVILPGFLAFFFLSLITSENQWVSWFLSIGGWYLSSLIWWHLYQHHMIDRAEPSRKMFYACCLLAQFSLALLVTLFVFFQY